MNHAAAVASGHECGKRDLSRTGSRQVRSTSRAMKAVSCARLGLPTRGAHSSQKRGAAVCGRHAGLTTTAGVALALSPRGTMRTRRLAARRYSAIMFRCVERCALSDAQFNDAAVDGICLLQFNTLSEQPQDTRRRETS